MSSQLFDFFKLNLFFLGYSWFTVLSHLLLYSIVTLSWLVLKHFRLGFRNNSLKVKSLLSWVCAYIHAKKWLLKKLTSKNLHQMLYPPSPLLRDAPTCPGGGGLGEESFFQHLQCLVLPSAPRPVTPPFLMHFLPLFLVTPVLWGFGSLFSCPCLSHTKEISNKPKEWNWVTLRCGFFFHSTQWIPERWLQRLLLSGLRSGAELLNSLITDHNEAPSLCPAGTQVSRCERGKLPKPEASPYSRVEGLSVLHPPSRRFLFTFCAILLCRAWLPVPVLPPSFPNSGRAHLHPWVAHSFSQQTWNMLLLGAWSMVES